MKRKRILFGTVDIGFRIELYQKFIKNNYKELDAESVNIFVLPEKHYKTNFTYEFSYFDKSRIRRYFLTFKNFLRFFNKYDIFHFLSGETLLTRKLRPLEFRLYKLLGKRIVLNFVGSDIRSEFYLYWKDKHLKEYLAGTDNPDKTSPNQKKLINDALKYGDYLIVSTPDLLEFLPKAKFQPVTLDLDRFLNEIKSATPYPKEKDEIVILHVPSNSSLKGTAHIKRITEEFARKSKLKVKVLIPEKSAETSTDLVYTMTRYELFKMLNTADIVIDQLVIGWYGLQSVEALAAGKQVICYIDKKLENYLYPDCPIHNADLNTLESVLEKCVQAVADKKTDSPAQLEWVKKYHTVENNHSVLAEAWQVSETPH